MLKIFKYFDKKDWLLVLCSLVFIVTQVWLDLKLPEYMTEITVLVQTEGSKTIEVLAQGGFMLLCAIGSMLASMATVFLATRIAAGFSVRLRGLVFNKTLSFSLEELSHFSTPSLITRSTNDIMQIQMLIIMGLQIVIRAPIMAVWAIFKINGKAWEWTAATGVAVAFLSLLIVLVVFIALPKFRVIQTLTDQLNRVTRENISGIRVVRAYNAEGYQEEKFEQANDELTKTNLFTGRTMAVVFPSIGLVMSGMNLAIYWIGAVLINNASMQDRLFLFSDMVVFSSYAMQIIMAFMMLSMVFIMMPRAVVSAKRVNEVLDTKVKIIDGTDKEAKKTQLSGEIEFRNVSYKYPDAEDYVIKNVSFRAHRGETVAIIGSTGSGKSTLLNLIPRFMDATDGDVLVDGVNVKQYPLEELRNKVGYVSQKAVMFSGSVTSNVAFGKDTEKATEVKKAVEIAQGKEFVEKMEGQYEGEIAQNGTNISGGQKQRISIARAIFKNPEIYLFDDSFSALDYKTDRILRSRLKQEIKNTTSIIVAQRIGTIIDADRIIVLDEGEVVGVGTHNELMNHCSVYQEIAYSQLSKEELEIGR